MAIVPLDSFFTDFVTEALKPIPNDAPSKVYSTIICNKNVPYYIINDKRGMFFEQIAFMLEAEDSAVKQRFNILKKRIRLDKQRFFLMEHQHYIYVERSKGQSNLKLRWKPGRKRPFIFWEGISIIFGFMRGEIRDEVYLSWNENLHKQINKQRNLPVSSPCELVPFGTTGFSKNFTHILSKMESITCDIFYNLGIGLKVMQTLHPQHLSKKSQVFLQKYNWKYVDFDFFVTTKPQTIIDVNGMEGKFSYWIKEQICKIEGWSYFIIKKDEDKNIPKLRDRIKKNFVGGN